MTTTLQLNVQKQYFDSLWQTYLDLGLSAFQNRRPEIAEMLLDAALQMVKSLAIPQVDVARKLFNLASIYCEYRRFRKALILFKKAMVLFERSLDSGHPLALRTCNAIAAIYLEKNKITKAKSYYEKVVSASERCAQEDPALLSEVFMRLSWIYMNEHRHRRAEELYKRALRLRQQTM